MSNIMYLWNYNIYIYDFSMEKAVFNQIFSYLTLFEYEASIIQ